MPSVLTKVFCYFSRGSWPSFKMQFFTHIFQKMHCLAADLSRIRRIGRATELRFRDSAPARVSQVCLQEVWWPQHFFAHTVKTYCPNHKTWSEISRLVKRPWLEYEWWEKSRVVWALLRCEAGENKLNCPSCTSPKPKRHLKKYSWIICI